MVVAASSGNLVEWFDYYIYAAFSSYFASQFFPKGNQTSQFLDSAAVFLVGFLARPVGGYVFGRLADRMGRKRAMVISVSLACLGSLIFACLPSYGHGSYSVGGLAPVLMMLTRLLQGFAVGGEYGTAATYMTEIAPRERRGLFSSFQYVTLIGGQLLASLVATILQLFLSEQQLTDWGWRIPFLIGAMAAVVSFFLRRGLAETTTKADRSQAVSGTFRGVLAYPRSFWVVLGLTCAGSLIFYAFTTYSKTYMINTTGISKQSATTVTTICLAIFMCIQPLFGMLSDRIGRRTSLMAFYLLMAIVTIPAYELMKNTRSIFGLICILTVVFCVMSLYTSVAGVAKAEMFPPAVRAMGVGFTYAIGNSLFGGSAEYVALWFKKIGHQGLFGWYVVVLSVVGLVAAYYMWDNRKRNYLDHHHDDVRELIGSGRRR
ncbi:MFS transporter [Nakamurella aerolata]